MQITLDDREAQVVKHVLSEALSDLRMEIRDTENFDMRQQLKNDEDVLRAVIERLGSPGG